MSRFKVYVLMLTATLLATLGAAQTLTMWVRTPETVDLLRESAERFNEANPDITVEVVPFAADAYPGALQAAISGGDLPDIFQVTNEVPVPRLEDLGLIQPLGEHFSEGYTEQFDPAIWWEGSTTLGGEIYAWPDRSFRRASLFLYYNKDVMEDAGLDPDTPPVTWDEFIEQAAHVSEQGAGRLFGLHLGFTSGWFNERVFLQLATTVSDDHGVPAEHLPGRMVNWRDGTMFDHDEIPAVMQFFRELMESDGIHPDYLNTGRSQAAAQWAAGQSAFLFDGSWRLQEILRTEPDLNFGITFLPSQSGNPPLWGVQGGSQNAFAVASTSQNVEAAAQFFEFLTEDYYPKLLEGSVDLTPIPELNARDDIEAAPEFSDLIALTEQATVVLPSPVMENSDNLETLIRLAGKSARQPFGESVQGFLAEGRFDISDYLEDYAATQQRFLEESIEEARDRGAEVSMDEWLFPDWESSENYY